MNWSASKLYQSSTLVSPSRRNPTAAGRLVLTNVVPYVPMKSMLCQFSVYGVTVQAIHQVNLMFSGLELGTEDPKKDGFLKVKYRGFFYFIQKPSALSTKLVVRCSCPDFYFTFSYWNYIAGALFGPKARPYRRKSNRAERNPTHSPGFCKHCFWSLRMMSEQTWLLES